MPLIRSVISTTSTQRRNNVIATSRRDKVETISDVVATLYVLRCAFQSFISDIEGELVHFQEGSSFNTGFTSFLKRAQQAHNTDSTSIQR